MLKEPHAKVRRAAVWPPLLYSLVLFILLRPNSLDLFYCKKTRILYRTPAVYVSDGKARFFTSREEIDGLQINNSIFAWVMILLIVFTQTPNNASMSHLVNTQKRYVKYFSNVG